MRKAFTLIEVNLAMLIMAGGLLSILGLYAFGFRENSQSREDVASAAVAELVMSPLITAIGATNVTWTSFKNSFTYPANGWKDYMNGGTYKVTSDPQSQASTAFSQLMGKLQTSGGNKGDNANTSFPAGEVNQTGLSCALVVHHEENSGVVSIALRAVQKGKHSTLMSQPVYYTEVAFQGVAEEKK